jgi:hypothetical protein
MSDRNPAGQSPPYSPRRVYLLPGEKLYAHCPIRPQRDEYKRRYIPAIRLQDETVLARLEQHLGRRLRFGDPN